VRVWSRLTATVTVPAQAARAALRGGASVLAVATALEAGELRRDGLDAPILVLGAVSPEELPVAVAARAELTAWDLGFIEQLAYARALGRRADQSAVKLDTGLRQVGDARAGAGARGHAGRARRRAGARACGR